MCCANNFYFRPTCLKTSFSLEHVEVTPHLPTALHIYKICNFSHVASFMKNNLFVHMCIKQLCHEVFLSLFCPLSKLLCYITYRLMLYMYILLMFHFLTLVVVAVTYIMFEFLTLGVVAVTVYNVWSPRARCSSCCNPITRFYRQMTNPKYNAVTDVYAYMFFCDFIDFFIIVFCYWAFGPVVS